MAGRRVLIIANEAVADVGALPEVVRRQVAEAEEVCVVASILTTRLQWWVSDIDAAAVEADDRMNAIVGSIGDAGPAIRGRVGDDPLQAVADALEQFPADALVLGVHPPDVANWQERRLTEDVCARFGLPVTEILVDRGGRVAAVSAD